MPWRWLDVVGFFRYHYYPTSPKSFPRIPIYCQAGWNFDLYGNDTRSRILLGLCLLYGRFICLLVTRFGRSNDLKALGSPRGVRLSKLPLYLLTSPLGERCNESFSLVRLNRSLELCVFRFFESTLLVGFLWGDFLLLVSRLLLGRLTFGRVARLGYHGIEGYPFRRLCKLLWRCRTLC